MYYILNQTDQIVAVDPQLLEELHIGSIEELYARSAGDELSFSLSGDAVEISYKGETKRYDAQSTAMVSLLGELRIVTLTAAKTEESAEETQETAVAPQPQAQAEEEALSISLDEVDLFEEPVAEKTETVEESPTEETIEIEDDELFTLLDTDEASVPETDTQAAEEAKKEDLVEEDDELFDLLLPSDADNAIAEIDTESANETKPQTPVEEEDTPIYIDVERISQSIGISTEDYNLFLNEYIDTALNYEEALQSENDAEKGEALDALAHLSNVLHLPFVGDLLTQIRNASENERDGAIKAFFSTLGRLTTAQFDDEKIELSLEEPPTAQEQETESETQEEAAKEEPVQEKPVEGKREPIDLSDVKPIHFDFQLEEAANDLSLPVELIEEFVTDFIAQAHEETEKMLAAYEKGDLETVQKIGHLLKGTSSNLRITPLSDTLYEIQFNEDIDKVPELVRTYWAHFLSLENQFKLISNK